MITKNFKMVARLPFTTTGNARNNVGNCRNISGDYEYPSMSNVTSTTGGDFPLFALATSSNRYIGFGNGTTPPTTSDYCLESAVTGLTISSMGSRPNSTEDGNITSEVAQEKYNNIDNTGIINYTCTVYNGTQNDITVSEMVVGMYPIDGKVEGLQMIIAREVFDAITIQPNETYSFYLKIG